MQKIKLFLLILCSLMGFGLSGVDKVITPDNIGEMLKAGGGSITTDSPSAPKYIEVTGMTSFLSPHENITINFSFVDVQLNIQTNAFNITTFQRKYKDASVCISLDFAPFSCWTMFNMKRHPRFANLPDGWHFFETYLIDPINRTFAELSYSNSTFPVKKFNESELEAYKEQQLQEALNRSKYENDTVSESMSQTEEEDDGSPVSLPFVSIDSPMENHTVNMTFEVSLQIITTSNVNKFKKVFEPSYMCLSLDAAPCTCWPIFEERYLPKFAKVKPGWHNLTAQVTHPQSGELIFGTGLGVRNFYVQNVSDEVDIILPWMLELEDEKPAEKNDTCADENDEDEYEDYDDWLDYNRERRMRIHRPVRGKKRGPRGMYVYEDLQQPITVYNYNYGKQDSDVEGDTRQPKLQKVQNESKTFEIKKAEAVDEVMLHLSVGGEALGLRVAKGDNYEKKALDFCYEYQITEPSCVPSLINEMKVQWSHLK